MRAGDACPNCGGPLEIARGIEIGHIFQLGRKYAEALGLQVLDQNGKQVTVDDGLVRHRRLARRRGDRRGDPRRARPVLAARGRARRRALVIAGKEGGPQRPAAEALAAELEAAGLRVLFDDRDGVSPGVKFKDAELIGVPTIVVVGRGIADDGTGTVEVKDRKSGERVDVAARATSSPT